VGGRGEGGFFEQLILAEHEPLSSPGYAVTFACWRKVLDQEDRR
jgi:hypothetical protein